MAVSRTVQGNQDVWLLSDMGTTRLTFDPAGDSFPTWSPDASRVVYRSSRAATRIDLYQKLASGVGEETLLVASDQPKTPTSWSVDGRFLLFHSSDPQTNFNLWAMPLAGNRTPFVFLKSSFREGWGALSRDGRWVVYHANDSDRNEIYVRPFSGPAETQASLGQWPVSKAGGVFPTWRPDGKELYFLNPAGEMMAAQVTATGATLDLGSPVVLFQTRVWRGGVDTQQGRQYDVAPDGRFLINTELAAAAAPITLIQNWNPDAKK